MSAFDAGVSAIHSSCISFTHYSRRDVLKFAGLATASLAGVGTLARAQEAVTRGSAPVKITDVKTILTQPGSDFLVIVKILTSEPGLYGIGCATHGERPLAVATVDEQYLKPLLVGKCVDGIEDIWQTNYVASYFRSGATLNNALSGIPLEAYDYVVNGKSALEWIMERYTVTLDKDSGIKNDPNDWAREHNQPRYILDLAKRIVRVSIKTMKIVNALPALNEMK